MDRLLSVTEVSHILAMDEFAICKLYKEYRIPGVFMFDDHFVIAESNLQKWIDSLQDPQKDYRRRLENLKRAGYRDFMESDTVIADDADIAAYAEKKNRQETERLT